MSLLSILKIEGPDMNSILPCPYRGSRCTGVMSGPLLFKGEL